MIKKQWVLQAIKATATFSTAKTGFRFMCNRTFFGIAAFGYSLQVVRWITF